MRQGAVMWTLVAIGCGGEGALGAGAHPMVGVYEVTSYRMSEGDGACEAEGAELPWDTEYFDILHTVNSMQDLVDVRPCTTPDSCDAEDERPSDGSWQADTTEDETHAEGTSLSINSGNCEVHWTHLTLDLTGDGLHVERRVEFAQLPGFGCGIDDADAYTGPTECVRLQVLEGQRLP